jgi:Uma2 family endonuclease
MAKALTDLRMTVAEFARWHDGTDTRHELVRGRVVAMAPPSGRHAELCNNIHIALNRRLRRPCRALFGAGVARDLDDEECRIPDVFVTCGPTPEQVFLDPRLVVEVLSPTTEREDRTAKLDFYKALSSVEAVLLVWQDTRLVQLHAREGRRWIVRDISGTATVPLAGLGVDLDLDEIYTGVDLPVPSRLPSLDPGE